MGSNSRGLDPILCPKRAKGPEPNVHILREAFLIRFSAIIQEFL
jgi:hypothetical protein